MNNKSQSTPHNLKEHQAQLERRQRRFRVLVCINGEGASLESVNLAAKLCDGMKSDIVLLYVRNIDQGLNAGGLQVRTARQNLLDWGLELPGIEYLRKGFELLLAQNFLGDNWKEQFSHTDVFGDPLGDNKVEYLGENGKRIVLKLNTAPDPIAGILHQYPLGPYNLILMGPSIQWTESWRSMFSSNIVQSIASLAPASVMTVRNTCQNGSGFLLSTDGSPHSLKAKKQGAVLAHELGEPVRILGTAADDLQLGEVTKIIEAFAKDLQKEGIEVLDHTTKIGNAVASTLEIGNSCAAIVVSDKQTSRFARFFKGSIAFDIMRLATTSVLNVR